MAGRLRKEDKLKPPTPEHQADADLFMKTIGKNYEELKVGYRESSVDATYKNAGYYKWLVKHYLWWEALIAFLLTGVITGTFYLVYVSEENSKKTKKKRK